MRKSTWCKALCLYIPSQQALSFSPIQLCLLQHPVQQRGWYLFCFSRWRAWSPDWSVQRSVLLHMQAVNAVQTGPAPLVRSSTALLHSQLKIQRHWLWVCFFSKVGCGVLDTIANMHCPLPARENATVWLYTPVMPICISEKASISPSFIIVSDMVASPNFRPFLMCSACGACKIDTWSNQAYSWPYLSAHANQSNPIYVRATKCTNYVWSRQFTEMWTTSMSDICTGVITWRSDHAELLSTVSFPLAFSGLMWLRYQFPGTALKVQCDTWPQLSMLTLLILSCPPAITMSASPSLTAW